MSARIFSRSRSSWQSQGGFFGRLLDPIDRLAQTIYSVLILLTFTLAFRVFNFQGEVAPLPNDVAAVNELLFAAIGATLAWGTIDGIMYLLLELFQRSERHRLLEQIQAAPDPTSGIALVAEEFDYVLDPITDEDERYQLYQSIYQRLLASEPRPIGLRRKDITGALGTLLVTILAVIPSFISSLSCSFATILIWPSGSQTSSHLSCCSWLAIVGASIPAAIPYELGSCWQVLVQLWF